MYPIAPGTPPSPRGLTRLVATWTERGREKTRRAGDGLRPQGIGMTEASKIKHSGRTDSGSPTLPTRSSSSITGGVGSWTRRHEADGRLRFRRCNVGHGTPGDPEAIAEQTVKLAYYPTTRQFSNRPAAELAAKLAELTPGDVDYTMFAVSGSEANERAMQIARHYWLAAGRPDKYKVVSLEGGYHGATGATLSVCGIPIWEAYGPLQTPGPSAAP